MHDALKGLYYFILGKDKKASPQDLLKNEQFFDSQHLTQLFGSFQYPQYII
jgi:hypothetical protein